MATLYTHPSFLLTLGLVFGASACVIELPEDGDDDVGDTTSDDTTSDDTTSTTDDTSTTDTTDDTSTTDTTDTTDTTESTDTTTGEPEVALVRFLNLSDGAQVRFRIGGVDVEGVELAFTQAHHYVELPVAGLDVEVEILDGEGNVVSNTVYPEFIAGHEYTVAAMGIGIYPNTWVNPDQYVDEVVEGDHTRLTLVNATPDVDHGIYAQLVYDNEFFIDFYVEHDNMLLDYAQQVTVDVPLPIVPDQSDYMALAAQWGVPPVAEQFWRGAALAQVANNESLDVFLTCTGACDNSQDRFLLGFMEDSSTFTVELLAQP